MRVSNQEKELSRERILKAAGQLFREHGVAGASVGDIMQAANMTHGGFYRHFPDKQALLAAAMKRALDDFAAPLQEGADPKAAVAAFIAAYLSARHSSNPAFGCPTAAVGPDIARQSDAVREAFSEGLNGMIEGLARGMGESPTPRDDALQLLATLVGAIVLARASTEDLSAEILAVCAKRLLPT